MVQVLPAHGGRKEFSHDNFLRAPAGISALKLTRAKARRVIQNYYLFIYYFKLRPSGFDHGGSILDHFQIMNRNETILIQTSTSNTTFALLFWFKVLLLKPNYHFLLNWDCWKQIG